MRNDLIIGMAGSGGDGIVSAGESLITAAALEGYYAIMTKSFGSQIRGGESSCRAARLDHGRCSTRAARSTSAVALNWEDFLKFGAELPVGGHTIVIYDSKTRRGARQAPARGRDAGRGARRADRGHGQADAGTEKAKNTVVLGLLAGWFGLAREAHPGRHPQEVRQEGRRSAAGQRARLRRRHRVRGGASARASRARWPPPRRRRPRRKLLVDGNDMCAAAAIFAGCKFFGGYPITPSSEIMQFFNREIWKYGGTVLQAEDEIAGIGAVVGASFAGKKAMTATSGPGMSLKTEMLGLATIAELPLVCVNVQRGGPSTGMPTKSEQSDLFQAVLLRARRHRPAGARADQRRGHVRHHRRGLQHRRAVPDAGHRPLRPGDRPAQGDRRPDRHLGLQAGRAAAADARRSWRTTCASATESGISPISHPGMKGGNYLASGIEHNERGRPDGQRRDARADERQAPPQAGPAEAAPRSVRHRGRRRRPLGLISWGSVAGVALEALRARPARGPQGQAADPEAALPGGRGDLPGLLRLACRRGLVVEQSHQGQLYRIIRMYVDVPRGHAVAGQERLQPDHRRREVVERLRKIGRSASSADGWPRSEPAGLSRRGRRP